MLRNSSTRRLRDGTLLFFLIWITVFSQNGKGRCFSHLIFAIARKQLRKETYAMTRQSNHGGFFALCHTQPSMTKYNITNLGPF